MFPHTTTHECDDESEFDSPGVHFKPFTDEDLTGEFKMGHKDILEAAPNPFDMFRVQLQGARPRMQALLTTDSSPLKEVIRYIYV